VSVGDLQNSVINNSRRVFKILEWTSRKNAFDRINLRIPIVITEEL
jgi:hypothetical protein